MKVLVQLFVNYIYWYYLVKVTGITGNIERYIYNVHVLTTLRYNQVQVL